jgi:hypothetical protein
MLSLPEEVNEPVRFALEEAGIDALGESVPEEVGLPLKRGKADKVTLEEDVARSVGLEEGVIDTLTECVSEEVGLAF